MTPQIPDIIYHYCPASALPEILRSSVVWVTHQRGLNDVHETNWAQFFIQSEINKRTTPANHKFISELVSGFTLNKQDVYLASFSQDGDVLSQWRAYGEDGHGFAIGFRPSAFAVDQRIPVTSTVADHTIGWQKIEYDDESLRAAIAGLFEFCLGGKGFPDVQLCTQMLRTMALTYKNPAFREEKEWRITYSPLITIHPDTKNVDVLGMLKDIKYRSTRYGIVPYFEIPVASRDKSVAIAEIVVGPKNQSHPALLNLMLKTYGYSECGVRRSAASYR